MTSILLVDDEPLITDSLAFNLREEGFDITVAQDGLQALEYFRMTKPDLVILDIRLPLLDGLEVCRRIRASNPVPIIMLTAVDDELDRVVGLEVGADDYVTKPFSFRELLARIRSLLRRVDLDHERKQANPVQVGSLRVDPTSRRVIKGDQELHLSSREFELLHLLMSHAGDAIPREELIKLVWGPGWSGDPRTLEVHIRWLRLKIEDDPTTPRFVRTVRGYGYRFAAPDELS